MNIFNKINNFGKIMNVFSKINKLTVT